MRELHANSSTVARRAHDVIARHAHFCGRADNFEFEVNNYVLVIRGRVPTFYLKQLLQDALKQLDGVQQIDNRVDVVAANGISSVVH
jgi:BON domain